MDFILKKSKDQYDLLVETSPEIRLKEIIKFNKIFSDAKFIKPEICNSLISANESVYKCNKTEDTSLTVNKIINDSQNCTIQLRD